MAAIKHHSRPAYFNSHGAAGTVPDLNDVPPVFSLTEGLVGYWPLDEVSGTRVATVGGVNLTEEGTGGFGSVAGKKNLGAYNGANAAGLGAPDNEIFRISPTTGKTFALYTFVYTPQPGIGTMAIMKANTGGTLWEYLLNVLQGSQGSSGTKRRLQWAVVGSDGSWGEASSIDTDISVTPPLSDWLLTIVWYDPVDKKAKGCIHDSAVVEGPALLTDPYSGDVPFAIGRQAGTYYPRSNADELLIWNRVLSADERVELRTKFYPFA